MSLTPCGVVVSKYSQVAPREVVGSGRELVSHCPYIHECDRNGDKRNLCRYWWYREVSWRRGGSDPAHQSDCTMRVYDSLGDVKRDRAKCYGDLLFEIYVRIRSRKMSRLIIFSFLLSSDTRCQWLKYFSKSNWSPPFFTALQRRSSSRGPFENELSSGEHRDRGEPAAEIDLFAFWNTETPLVVKDYWDMWLIITTVQCNLAKGRIAVLSPLEAANGFVWQWPSSKTIFLRPTRVSRPNGISISSVIFAQLTVYGVPNTQIDRQTTLRACDIRSSRPHLYALRACDAACSRTKSCHAEQHCLA